MSVDKKWIKSLQGKDFILYGGLVEEGHKRGLKSLEVTILQYPNDGNGRTAVCSATAKTGDGDTYTDIGDASPENVSKNIIPHILRMASTRSKARALRDLTNIGMTAFEELGEATADEPEQPDYAAIAFDMMGAMDEIQALPHLKNWWEKHTPEIDKMPKDIIKQLNAHKDKRKDAITLLLKHKGE